MAVQWPLLVSRLLVLLPTLDGWGQVSVFDGAAFDSSRPVFCTVAHSDDGQVTTAGSFATAQSDDGFQYSETGNVACQLTFTDDRATVAALRAKVFGLLDPLDAAIRADRRLGVLSADGYTQLDVNVTSTQLVEGAGLTLPFSINYFTVT